MRARYNVILFVVFTASFIIAVRTLLNGASLAEAIFEGLVGSIGGTLIARWLARRFAA